MQFGGVSFSYDANGSLTSDGTGTFTWNARNQLVALAGSVSGSFSYDGFGRRRAKTVSGTTTNFLYDGLNPVQELAGGLPAATLMTGLGIDEYITRTDAGGARHFLADELGSTVALTDGSGLVQTEYTYEPFGAFTTSGAATGNAFAFTGREADGTGLMYYRARHYDPRRQRFMSEDPGGFLDGANRFVYVMNDPANRTDPHGLQAVILGRIPFIPRNLPPGMRYNAGRPIPKETPPYFPRPVPWDPRFTPPGPKLDPFLEFLADILDGIFGGGTPVNPGPGRGKAQEPDCRLTSGGTPICKT